MSVTESSEGNEIWSEFIRRFYRFAQEDTRTEVLAGAPLIKALSAAGCRFTLPYGVGLSLEQELLLAKALINQRFGPTHVTGGTSLSKDENGALDRYRDYISSMREADMYKRHVYTMQVLERIDQAEFMKASAKSVEPIVGVPFRQDSRLQFHSTNIFGDWKLETRLSYSKFRWIQSSYFIVPKKRMHLLTLPMTPIGQFCWSSLGWLGLHSTDEIPACWEYEHDAAIDLTCQCISRFIDVFPRLVEGLEFEK